MEETDKILIVRKEDYRRFNAVSIEDARKIISLNLLTNKGTEFIKWCIKRKLLTDLALSLYAKAYFKVKYDGTIPCKYFKTYNEILESKNGWNYPDLPTINFINKKEFEIYFNNKKTIYIDEVFEVFAGYLTIQFNRKIKTNFSNKHVLKVTVLPDKRSETIRIME